VQSPTAPAAKATLRTLLDLAWPIVVSRATQVVVGFADAVMVSPLGAAALAATATGATNAFTLLILPMGVCFIIQSFAAQLFGRGDAAGARRFAWYGLGVALVTQVVSLLSLFFVAPVLDWLPYEPDVRALMTKYLAIRLLSGGAAIGIEALGNYYGGLSRTRPAMAANVTAMGLNVVGNWVFIGGHLGAPAMGVSGAALSSALATVVAFLGFFAWFLWDGRALPKPKLSRAELVRVLRFGLPSGFNWFFEFLAFLFFINVVVGGLGTPALAAMNAVLTLNSMSFMLGFGVASAGAILVGQAIGAGRKDDVPFLVKLTAMTSGTWQSLVGVAYLVAPALLLVPFTRGKDGAAVLVVGVPMLMVSAGWQLFDTAATTLAEALRAAGDTLFPLVARLIIAWVLFAPGSFLSVRVFGVNHVGVMGWLVFYLALLAAVLFWRFRSGAWRKVQLVEPTI